MRTLSSNANTESDDAAPTTGSPPRPKNRGRLELTWSNKDEALLAHESGDYEWVPKRDHRVAEVRLLQDAGEIGKIRPDSEQARNNLLIRGDSLNALTALNRSPEFAAEYAGKVKLAYIDPPFNTGQAFEHYDDGLEHSVWLTMMRDRLMQIKELLAPDGSVWVHLDDAEMAYCRVLMDEVFGRHNFVATVIWRAADSSNHDAKQFSADHNSILVYGGEPGWKSVPLERQAEHNAHYSNPDNDPKGDWFPGNVSSPNPRENLRFVIDESFGWGGTPIESPSNGWRWKRETIEEKIRSGEIELTEAEPGQPRLVRKTYLADQSGLAPSNLWAELGETGHNRQAKYELKKLFPKIATANIFKTPKPERLMERIIHIGSNPGDIILDCFAGSGTTAAVAHKMGRRWVTVEWSADTIDKFTAPRLEKVVKGEDPGGVTEQTGWEGGGGFRVLDVAPSIFEEDEGVVVLADHVSKTDLSEAVAAQLGFLYDESPPFCGYRGKIRLAVIDGHVDDEVVRMLVKALPKGEKLSLCATSLDPGSAETLTKLRRGSQARVVPQDILLAYRTPSAWRASVATPAPVATAEHSPQEEVEA